MSRRRRGRPKREMLEERVVRIDLEMLEIAKGHDGFLRGAPEPVIVIGLYARLEPTVVLIGRGVVRFAQPERIPSSVIAEAEHELRVDRRVSPGESFFAILCAMEEDSGDGVARAYELLAEPEALLCYRTAGESFDPVSIALDSPGVEPIELFARNRPFGEEVKGDDWVGAAFVCVPRIWSSCRVRFLSANNDWTAVARARS